MAKNGNTNGYVQVFKGPDGQPMVVLRGDDLVTLLNRVVEADKARTDAPRIIPLLKPDKIDDWLKARSAISDAIRYAGLEIPHSDDDETAYAQAKAALASGEDEIVPGDVAKRIIGGEIPLKVWREYRGLKQKDLEAMSGVGQDVISKIENKKRTGDVATLKALADSLGVLVDDLVI